jgi:excisionase family DNA binding protein
MSKLARMRLLDECYAEIKALDPNTSISKHYIRQLAISGKIPVVMAGRKRLINLDGLIEYLSSPHNAAASSPIPINGIRSISR